MRDDALAPGVYQVTHSKAGVDTIYLVTATSERDAKTQVLDTLYVREHSLGRGPQTPEQRDRDVFGLWTNTGSWTNAALCKQNGCSISVQPYRPDVYRLYAYDTKTGVMS